MTSKIPLALGTPILSGILLQRAILWGRWGLGFSLSADAPPTNYDAYFMFLYPSGSANTTEELSEMENFTSPQIEQQIQPFSQWAMAIQCQIFALGVPFRYC